MATLSLKALKEQILDKYRIKNPKQNHKAIKAK